MPIRIDISVPNITEVQQDFNATVDRVADTVESGLPMDFAGSILRVARRLVPVRTGRLRRSLGIRRISGGVVAEAAAPYAGYVEDRRPFMGRGLADAQRKAQQTTETALNRAIE